MKLMVLDGNSIVNRAYYGIRPLTTRQGLYTNAIYGFLIMMNKIMEEETPDGLSPSGVFVLRSIRELGAVGGAAGEHLQPVGQGGQHGG